jgi:hypothetical protein
MNQEPAGELTAVRDSVIKGKPFGTPGWVEHMAATWSLFQTLRARGRPKRDVELIRNGS